MKISITGHHVNITDTLNSYTKTKFQKLKKHSENIINIHAILTVEKERMKAEATLKTKNGKLYCKLLLVRTDDLIKNKINIAGKMKENIWMGEKRIEFVIEDISLN